MSHTKGPWTIGPPNFMGVKGYRPIQAPDDGVTAVVAWIEGDVRPPEDADLAMLAAAPSLYAALERFVAVAHHGPRCDMRGEQPCTCGMGETIVAGRHALARARGGS